MSVPTSATPGELLATQNGAALESRAPATAAPGLPAAPAGTQTASPTRPAQPGTTAPATTPVMPEPQDLLEQRLLATERWLAEANGGVFSIQLLGSTDQQMLRTYLNDLSNYIEQDRIFVYRTVANQAPSITVLYGAFLARADAVRSLDGLPPELKANRPYIRTVQGIRSELGLDNPS